MTPEIEEMEELRIKTIWELRYMTMGGRFPNIWYICYTCVLMQIKVNPLLDM